MKFLLDMGLAQTTAAFLRSQGYDALHVREQGLQQAKDDEIVGKARREKRVIVTHDLDFGRLIALSQRQLPSVITLRLENMQPANVNRQLREVLARFSPELEKGALVSVNEQAIRVRSLPIE
jgi:predicted nuclease of predicted toxin-antitoxin system